MRNLRYIALALAIFSTVRLAAQEPLVRNMSIDELKACGAVAAATADRRRALGNSDGPLIAQGKAIAAESRAIDAARKLVNVRDTKAVAVFNARLLRSNATIKSYNAVLATRRQAVAGLNAQNQLFNLNCANRPYDKATLAQLVPEHRRAMEAGAQDIEIPMLPTALGVESSDNAGGGSSTPVVIVQPTRQPVPPEGGDIPVSSGLPLAQLKAAADGGNADAEFEMGARLHDGVGVPRDPPAALGWLLKAAAQHHAIAAFNASRMLSEGEDVPVDKPKALELLRQAAAAGQLDAQHNLALWYASESKETDHLERALEWMTRAADHGDPESQFVLAGFYRGTNGMPRNLAISTTRLRQSADQGFRQAQLDLGRAYAKGDGVPRNPVEALKWFRLAGGMTKIDASQGCGRLLLADAETRTRATTAANDLAAKLSPYEADKAAGNADEWVTSARAHRVGGCGRALR